MLEPEPEAGFPRWRVPWWAAGAALVGLLWRAYYLFYTHPASEHIYKDMGLYVRWALNQEAPGYRPALEEVLKPPGMAWYLAALHTPQLEWQAALAAQWLLCSLTPILAAALAHELYGAKAACVALVLASFHFPFLDYASYFLPETPFLFLLLLSAWFMVRSLRAKGAAWAVALGLGSGLCLGAAAGFKGTALLPAALAAFWLARTGWKRHWKRVPLALGAASAGLLLLLVPLTLRSTRLNEGRFCLVSADGALAVLQGHLGHAGVFKFEDHKRGRHFKSACTTCYRLGYQDSVTLPMGPYDEEDILSQAGQWIRTHPAEALVKSVEHVSVLFAGGAYWPSALTPQRKWAVLGEELFWLFILLPACYHLWNHARALMRGELHVLGDLFLLALLLGLLLGAFLSHGEPRDRVPFDGFLILLAARAYTQGAARQDGLRPPEALSGTSTPPPPSAASMLAAPESCT